MNNELGHLENVCVAIHHGASNCVLSGRHDEVEEVVRRLGLEGRTGHVSIGSSASFSTGSAGPAVSCLGATGGEVAQTRNTICVERTGRDCKPRAVDVH